MKDFIAVKKRFQVIIHKFSAIVSDNFVWQADKEY